MWFPEGWAPLGWGAEGWEPEGQRPERGPEGGRPNISQFFPSHGANVVLFLCGGALWRVWVSLSSFREPRPQAFHTVIPGSTSHASMRD